MIIKVNGKYKCNKGLSYIIDGSHKQHVAPYQVRVYDKNGKFKGVMCFSSLKKVRSHLKDKIKVKPSKGVKNGR